MSERRERWERLRVDFCRQTAGKPVPKIAEACEVSRQAVYGWLHGATPRAENLTRIERMVREE